MSKIRRWLGRFTALAAFATLAACCAFQPSLTPGPQPASSAVITTAPSEPDPLDDWVQKSLEKENQQEQAASSPIPVSQDTPLVHALAERFHKPETLIQRVVDAANRLAHGDFPLRNDILAIIAVESSFNPRASYKGSKGLMQVQISSHRKELAGRDPYNIEDNIAVGAGILRGYYESLRGNRRAAVLAYNSGIGRFDRGRYQVVYYRKYLRELAFVESIAV